MRNEPAVPALRRIPDRWAGALAALDFVLHGCLLAVAALLVALAILLPFRWITGLDPWSAVTSAYPAAGFWLAGMAFVLLVAAGLYRARRQNNAWQWLCAVSEPVSAGWPEPLTRQASGELRIGAVTLPVVWAGICDEGLLVRRMRYTPCLLRWSDIAELREMRVGRWPHVLVVLRTPMAGIDRFRLPWLASMSVALQIEVAAPVSLIALDGRGQAGWFSRRSSRALHRGSHR